MVMNDMTQMLGFDWERLSREDMLFMNRMVTRWLHDGGTPFRFMEEECGRMRRLFTAVEQERISGIIAKCIRFRDPAWEAAAQ